MTKLLGISGSLRKASYNTALLRAAQTVAPDGVTFETATLHGIPLYDGDLEAESGVPAAAEALKRKIVAPMASSFLRRNTTTRSRAFSRMRSTG